MAGRRTRVTTTIRSYASPDSEGEDTLSFTARRVRIAAETSPSPATEAQVGRRQGEPLSVSPEPRTHWALTNWRRQGGVLGTRTPETLRGRLPNGVGRLAGAGDVVRRAMETRSAAPRPPRGGRAGTRSWASGRGGYSVSRSPAERVRYGRNRSSGRGTIQEGQSAGSG